MRGQAIEIEILRNTVWQSVQFNAIRDSVFISAILRTLFYIKHIIPIKSSLSFMYITTTAFMLCYISLTTKD